MFLAPEAYLNGALERNPNPPDRDSVPGRILSPQYYQMPWGDGNAGGLYGCKLSDVTLLFAHCLKLVLSQIDYRSNYDDYYKTSYDGDDYEDNSGTGGECVLRILKYWMNSSSEEYLTLG